MRGSMAVFGKLKLGKIRHRLENEEFSKKNDHQSSVAEIRKNT